MPLNLQHGPQRKGMDNQWPQHYDRGFPFLDLVEDGLMPTRKIGRLRVMAFASTNALGLPDVLAVIDSAAASKPTLTYEPTMTTPNNIQRIQGT
jgi:hypothetical protein